MSTSLSRVKVCPNVSFLVFQFSSRARWQGSARPLRSRGRNRKLWPGGDSECSTGQSHEGTFSKPGTENHHQRRRRSTEVLQSAGRTADAKQLYLDVSTHPSLVLGWIWRDSPENVDIFYMLLEPNWSEAFGWDSSRTLISITWLISKAIRLISNDSSLTPQYEELLELL